MLHLCPKWTNVPSALKIRQHVWFDSYLSASDPLFKQVTCTNSDSDVHLLYYMTCRNQDISSSLPTLVTVMSTQCCQPKNYMAHLQIMASVSRCQHCLGIFKPYKRSTSRVLSPSILNSFCLLVTSFSSPQSAVQPGSWSCFVRMMNRPGPAGSQPCACWRLACWLLTPSDV